MATTTKTKTKKKECFGLKKIIIIIKIYFLKHLHFVSLVPLCQNNLTLVSEIFNESGNKKKIIND